MDKVLKDKVKSWLEKTGYPLELHVHQAVLAKGYICEKSRIYTDIETGDSREIDLVAYLNADHNGKNYFYEVQLVIECKKSEKPLVILSSGGVVKERFAHYMGSETIHDLNLDNGRSYMYLHNLSQKERHERIGRFSENIRTGYSIIPAFSKSDENIYKGIMGLAKASEYYRNQYHDLAKDDDEPWYRMQLPVLVVDAELLLAYLDEKGESCLEVTNWASLQVRLPWAVDRSDEERLCNIQVVSKEYFTEFLSEVECFHRHLIDVDSILFRS